MAIIYEHISIHTSGYKLKTLGKQVHSTSQGIVQQYTSSSAKWCAITQNHLILGKIFFLPKSLVCKVYQNRGKP